MLHSPVVPRLGISQRLRAAVAFDTVASYRACNDLAHQTLTDAFICAGVTDKAPAAVRWLAQSDVAMLVQISRRTVRPGPEGNGAIEAEIRSFREHLASRAQSLRNVPRADRIQGRINQIKRCYGWDRTELARIQGART